MAAKVSSRKEGTTGAKYTVGNDEISVPVLSFATAYPAKRPFGSYMTISMTFGQGRTRISEGMYIRPLKSKLSPSAEVDVMLQPILMTSSLFHNLVLVLFVGRQATSQHPYHRCDHMLLYSPPRLAGYLFRCLRTCRGKIFAESSKHYQIHSYLVRSIRTIRDFIPGA
jgi:hypothetical protein